MAGLLQLGGSQFSSLRGSILDALGVRSAGDSSGSSDATSAIAAEEDEIEGLEGNGGREEDESPEAARAPGAGSSSSSGEDVGNIADVEEQRFILGARARGKGAKPGGGDEEGEGDGDGEGEGDGDGEGEEEGDAAEGDGEEGLAAAGAGAAPLQPEQPAAAVPAAQPAAAVAPPVKVRPRKVRPRRPGRGGGAAGAGRGKGGVPADYPPVVTSPVHPQILTDLSPWAGGGDEGSDGSGGGGGGFLSALLGGGGSGGSGGDSPRRLFDPSRGHGIALGDLLALVARDMERPVNQRRLVLVYVINNRMVMDWDNWGSNRQWGAKLSDFAAQLASVLRAPNVSVPDCVFVAQLASVPYARKAQQQVGEAGGASAASSGGPSGPPVFSMAKSDAYWDVLYPNPYFGTWDKWERSAGGMIALASSTPWESKAAVAFWRGSCVNWPGSRPRVDLVMKHAAPGFDTAFIRPCPVGAWPALLPDRASDRLLKRTIGKLPRSRIVGRAEFARYRYLFHMPGSTQGSYSRNMQIALGVGSVVLKWDNPFYEFFYSNLTAWTHYVPVNASNAVEVVARLTSDDAMARRIASSTREWYANNLRGRHIRDYWVQLLSTYAQLQRFTPAPPANPCSCEKASERGAMRRCKVC